MTNDFKSISTEGGFVAHGDVSAMGDVIGRDQFQIQISNSLELTADQIQAIVDALLHNDKPRQEKIIYSLIKVGRIQCMIDTLNAIRYLAQNGLIKADILDESFEEALGQTEQSILSGDSGMDGRIGIIALREIRNVLLKRE